jgi:two-component system LytT family response regulator
MTCIIIDDEPNAIDIIKRYVGKISYLELKNTFRNPLKAIEWLQMESVDLVFLDINMPNLNGIEFIKSLSIRPMIIFTTAYSEFAAESYELDAVDYLVKPIPFERFIKAANKANGNFQQKAIQSAEKMPGIIEPGEFVLLKSGAQTHRLRVEDILFVEKDGNYLKFCTATKMILYRANMADVFDLLPADKFIQVHKSFVVSFQYVSLIEVHQLTINNTKIPIGETFREEFIKGITKRSV